MNLFEKLQSKRISGEKKRLDRENDREKIAEAISECIDEEGAITSIQLSAALSDILEDEGQDRWARAYLLSSYVTGNRYMGKLGIKTIPIRQLVEQYVNEHPVEGGPFTAISVIGRESAGVGKRVVYYKNSELLPEFIRRRIREDSRRIIFEFSDAPFEGRLKGP